MSVHTFSCLDGHTCGNPVRLVSGGAPLLKGATMSERRLDFLEHHDWIRRALTPTPAQPTYGFMNYYLNTGRKYLPDAPAEAYAHVGAGTNAIYVDPVNDLVVVVRWIEGKAVPELVRRMLGTIEDTAAARPGR